MIFFSYPAETPLCIRTASLLKATLGKIECHMFPDTEMRVTVKTDVQDQPVWIMAQLDQVNDHIMGLILLIDTCRSLGARSVKLVTPYLPYMRQDVRFHLGESVSAKIFADLLSHYVDALVTVDPHCHRISQLSDIYTVPCYTLHAEPLIKTFIQDNIQNPLIIGPDAESEQWVSHLAQSLSAPYQVLTKKRLGDAHVDIQVPELHDSLDHTVVMIDDMISTGKTMVVALDQLIQQGFKSIYVVAVHGLFVNGAYEALLERTPHVLTSNSIQHVSNQLDLSVLIAQGIRDAI